MRWKPSSLALVLVTTLVACSGGGSTGPKVSDQAGIQGRVEQTQAQPVSARGQAAGAPSVVKAATVTVARIGANGSLAPLASANVNVDGSFLVRNVTPGLDDLVVEAYAADGTVVGGVMVYGTTAAGTILSTEPITPETTVTTRSYRSLKATGKADLTSRAEVTLLLHVSPGASAAILANDGVTPTAEGLGAAGDAFTQVFALMGTSLDASARATVLAPAAGDFAQARFSGESSDSAHAELLRTALTAYQDAGLSDETVAEGSATAASLFDARLDGATSARGELVSQAVMMNLAARRALAARFEDGAQSSVAGRIASILAATEASVRGTSTAADLRSALSASAAAADSASIVEMVDFLVPNGTTLQRSQVETAAHAVADAATLGSALSAATTVQEAVQALADYRSSVKTAVQAMLQTAGRTDLDADTMTSLYIAAYGGAYIRPS